MSTFSRCKERLVRAMSTNMNHYRYQNLPIVVDLEACNQVDTFKKSLILLDANSLFLFHFYLFKYTLVYLSLFFQDFIKIGLVIIFSFLMDASVNKCKEKIRKTKYI